MTGPMPAAENAGAGATSAVRQAYYDRISKLDMAPLWEVMKGLVPKEPNTPCVPAIWHFDAAKKLVMESGDIISAEEAERRVLVLENPAMRGRSRITQSLYAGLQMILPGEIAPAHRHTASAIRLILDGEGGYTAVEGEKTLMKRGDFIITANWAAHDHGHLGKGPMIWLDVLDIPTVNFFDTGFAEHLERATQSNTREDGDSWARFGSGVLPDGASVRKDRSPIINYPYAKMRPILERLRDSDDIDPRHGARIRYANPLTGGWATPIMGPHLSLLPKGFKGKPYRSTDGTIFACIEGEGTTKIDGKEFSWKAGDVFVAPSWKEYSHSANAESVLFGISDRPAQESLGIWREAA